MNEMIRICRSMVRSEHAIRLLSANVTCIAIAGLCLAGIVSMQNKEIEKLQKQVSDLEGVVKANNKTEEQTNQKGA